MDYFEFKEDICQQLRLLKEFTDIKSLETSFDEPKMQLSVYIPIDNDFRAEIYFKFLEFKESYDVKYYLEFEQKLNNGSFIGIMPKKFLVPQEIIDNCKYRAGRYSIVKGGSVLGAGENIIRIVLNNIDAISEMCKASTCWRPDGTLKYNLKDWKTEATLLEIKKEMPVVRMVSGIKKDRQPYYDNAPGIHGSNGTYAEYANPEWILKYRVKRLGIEIDSSEIMIEPIHNYIEEKLKPRLDWGRITEQRLEKINELIHNKKLEIITYDMNEAPIYRNFKPLNFNNWEEALNHFLRDL